MVPTDLEPRSSEGEGGKLCHLFAPPSSSGRLQVCLHTVAKSRTRLAFPCEPTRVLPGVRRQGRRDRLWGELGPNRGGTWVSHFRLPPRRIAAPVTLPRVVAMLVIAVGVLSFGSIGSAASTSLVINEVDYDQPLLDTAELLRAEERLRRADQSRRLPGRADQRQRWRALSGARPPERRSGCGRLLRRLRQRRQCGELRHGRRSRYGSDPERRARRAPAHARPRADADRRRQLRGRHRGRDRGLGYWARRHRRRRACARRERLALPRRR